MTRNIQTDEQQMKTPAATLILAKGLMLLSTTLPQQAKAHGSLENGRMLQVRLAGPNGYAPAPWNDSYYTWNQNSQNFPSYAQPSFSYAQAVPDGTIASAGINDGVQTPLNFSGLNLPSAGWQKTPAQAGATVPLIFLATAPHDPSHFEVYLTKQGFNVATQTLGWENLEHLGRWEIGDAQRPVTLGTRANPVTGGSMPSYEWNVPIPPDRNGHHAVVVIWQRQDPAGEAFFAVQDLAITAVSAPAAVLGIARSDDGAVTLELRGSASTEYTIEWSADLALGTWQALHSGTTDTQGILRTLDAGASERARRFYRAVTVADEAAPKGAR